MSAVAMSVISAMESLPDGERDAVLAEMLRRHPVGGEIPESAMLQAAEELFLSYEDEESADAAAH